MFHAFWGPGHNATDYKRFYNSSPGEVYKVTKYQSAYEPYIIFKKDGPPWYVASALCGPPLNQFSPLSRCDERFVGYGGNKAACLFEMYLAGVSYYVLADHFIIHQNHLYEETVRIHEVRPGCSNHDNVWATLCCSGGTTEDYMRTLKRRPA